MASKLLIVCALVCAIQGLNAATFLRAETQSPNYLYSVVFKDAMEYFQNLEKEYGSIIDKFENVVIDTEAEGPGAEFGGHFEDIMKPIEEFASTELNEEAAGNNIIVECIRSERENFMKFVTQMRQRVIDAVADLRQFIRSTLGPYVQKAREAFLALGEAIAVFPARMWECIVEGNIMKAIEVVKDTRMVVTNSASMIRTSLREARTKFPMIREKAQKMREQIRTEAAAGMKIIRENIRKCIINGGPKPGQPAFIPEQIPFTQDIGLAAPVQQFGTSVAPGEQVSTLIAPADAVVSQSE